MGRFFLINSKSCWIWNSLDNWIFLSYHTVVYSLFPTPQVILLLILLYYLINKLTVQQKCMVTIETSMNTYVTFLHLHCLFVCFKGGGVHLAWLIESVFAEFPVGPALPPHPKMYREAWVKPNPVKDLKQDCSTSLSLTPCPWGGIASWTWGLWLCFLGCMAGFPITLQVVHHTSLLITRPCLVRRVNQGGRSNIISHTTRKHTETKANSYRDRKNIYYRIVASTNTCYYSENQVFGGVTIRVLCSKRGCY